MKRIALLVCLVACRSTPGAEPPSEVVAAGCTVVDAFTDNAIVQSICAKQEEIGTVLDVISSMRASAVDAGTAKVLRCRPIQGTKMCATEEERAAAIRAVLAKR